jgi:hypothetical protein
MKAIELLEKRQISKTYFDLYKKAIIESKGDPVKFNKLMKKHRELFLRENINGL